MNPLNAWFSAPAVGSKQTKMFTNKKAYLGVKISIMHACLGQQSLPKGTRQTGIVVLHTL